MNRKKQTNIQWKAKEICIDVVGGYLSALGYLNPK